MTTATLHRSDLAGDAIKTDPTLEGWTRTGKLSITYDQVSDSLTIHRFGRPLPSLVEPVNDLVARLVSLEDETQETGVLVESFLAVAMRQRPWLRPIAQLLKLPDRAPNDFSLHINQEGTTGAVEQIEPDEQWLQPASAAIARLLSEIRK